MKNKIQEQVLKEVFKGEGESGDLDKLIKKAISRTIELMDVRKLCRICDKPDKFSHECICHDCIARWKQVLLKKQKTVFRKMIEEMINFHQKKKEELIKKEADLIEIVPHIDYVTVLKELIKKLNDNSPEDKTDSKKSVLFAQSSGTSKCGEHAHNEEGECQIYGTCICENCGLEKYRHHYCKNFEVKK